jgi:hypothetical protein
MMLCAWQLAIVHVPNGANVLKDWVEISRTPLFLISEIRARPDCCLSFNLGPESQTASFSVLVAHSKSHSSPLSSRVRHTHEPNSAGMGMAALSLSAGNAAELRVLATSSSPQINGAMNVKLRLGRLQTPSWLRPGTDKLIVQLLRLHHASRCAMLPAHARHGTAAPAVGGRDST